MIGYKLPKQLTLLLTATFIFMSFIVSAQQIDVKSSKVVFSLSNMGFKTVEGEVTGMRGNVSFSSSAVEKSVFQVCVDPATINTDNTKRDEHLQKEDFFDVANHPTICFQSEQIQQTDKGYTAIGKLTMLGVTKTAEIPFVVADNTLKGTLVIERSDYELGPSGGFMVGQTVEMNITCVLK